MSKKHKQSNTETIEQMLERVMTVAELLTQRSVDSTADGQPTLVEKTQD